MTPTPETDAIRNQYAHHPQNWLADQFCGLAEKLERERNTLREAIRETIMENLHLADGDECTLKRLKDAIGFELPPENAKGEARAQKNKTMGKYDTTKEWAAAKCPLEEGHEIGAGSERTASGPLDAATCSPSGIDSDSIVASCNCMSKSPNYMHHRRGCKYRLIFERDEAREQRDNARATAATFRQCAELTFGVMPFPRKFHWENA